MSSRYAFVQHSQWLTREALQELGRRLASELAIAYGLDNREGMVVQLIGKSHYLVRGRA
jgi:hypothetical protein